MKLESAQCVFVALALALLGGTTSFGQTFSDQSNPRLTGKVTSVETNVLNFMYVTFEPPASELDGCSNDEVIVDIIDDIQGYHFPATEEGSVGLNLLVDAVRQRIFLLLLKAIELDAPVTAVFVADSGFDGSVVCSLWDLKMSRPDTVSSRSNSGFMDEDQPGNDTIHVIVQDYFHDEVYGQRPAYWRGSAGSFDAAWNEAEDGCIGGGDFQICVRHWVGSGRCFAAARPFTADLRFDWDGIGFGAGRSLAQAESDALNACLDNRTCTIVQSWCDDPGTDSGAYRSG